MSSIEQLYHQLSELSSLWHAPWSTVFSQLSTIMNKLSAKPVEIWKFNDNDEPSLTLIPQEGETNTSQTYSRTAKQYPHYFADLKTERIVNIVSIDDLQMQNNHLDEPLWQDNQPVNLHIPLRQGSILLGVLCIESIDKQAYAFKQLNHFLQTLANLLAQRLYHDNMLHEQLVNKALIDRLQATFDNAGDGILLSQNGHFVDCNQAILKMFGCTKSEIMNQNPARYSRKYQPDGSLSQDKIQQHINAAFAGQTQSFEWQHIRHDGSPFDAEVTLTVVKTDPSPLIHAIVRDISERKLANLQLQQSRSLLATQNRNLSLINALSTELHGRTSIDTIVDKTLAILLELSSTSYIAIYLVDEDKQHLALVKSHGFAEHIMQAGQRLSLSDGLNAKALELGRPIVTSNISTNEHANLALQTLVQSIKINSGAFIPLIYQDKPLGSVCLLYKGNHHFDFAEQNTFEIIGKNISLLIANAQHMNKLEYMAHHDSLTGLPNRALLHHEFENNIACGPGMPAVLMLIDLDRFKDINDTLGHYVGDLVLKQISPRISQCTQKYKTLICRLGGDEFTVLIYGNPPRDEVMQLTHDILNHLRAPINIDTMLLEIDASIGVAFYPADGKDSHALLRSADVAMYDAKRRGGGVTLYDSNKDIHTPERLTLMAELSNAIREQQLVLHYQPKIDLDTNKIIGFEALVRWDHPLSGLLYPDKFIPLAEVSDAIHHLTDNVLNMALAQQKAWREQGHNYTVAVNLSARNLADDRCVNNIKIMLDKYQTQPGMLELELTETALMQDPEKAVDLLMQLSALGVKLSVDDFGTGYSSLSYLRQLPIDTLKIDQQFVSDMLKNEQDNIIVRSTISLGHNLNLKVIAEGVEDQLTLAALQTMNCDIAQGYHISKPKSWPDIEQWLQQQS